MNSKCTDKIFFFVIESLPERFIRLRIEIPQGATTKQNKTTSLLLLLLAAPLSGHHSASSISIMEIWFINRMFDLAQV